ncbi:DUF222 domain-containing protein [Microbacterium sp. NPDC056003]|jgi:hypothetical protein|uniref:HNH endonuclease signature motif containing protein n=1 Tax=Microbacterium sp. NPDC056003 TaxID=3345676 RepID=UPI0035E3152A
MTDLAAPLNAICHELGALVTEAFGSHTTARLQDDDLLAALATLSGLRRQTDALLAELVAQVDERADAAPHAERITTVHGCRSVTELVQRVTLVSRRTAGELLRAGRGIAQETAHMTGAVLEATYPAMRTAAADGVVGIDALLAVIDTLDRAECEGAARRSADDELAIAARGAGDDAQPCADELRLQASVWAMYLDPDGAEPREARALRKRGLTLGVCRDGLVPLRGSLLPEVAGQLRRIFDSLLNPKVTASAGPVFVESETVSTEDSDPRSRVQKQHDALATALTVAARSGEMPTIGGSAPTLVVSVRSDDLAQDRGYAHLDDCDEPVGLSVARQVACTGAVQRVSVDERGRILAIGIADRVFAAHQRKAIALRDGGCVIPGCRVPSAWCEIHHVEEAARGGPTHTDNGVLLCWFHHRTIDTGGWKVRMNRGVPEIRGPSWWDPSARWHPATKSPTRLLDRRDARRPA